jgi:hypothetical protein
VFASANDLVAGAGSYVRRVVAQAGEDITSSAGVALTRFLLPLLIWWGQLSSAI